jgi:hypothetical protein
MQFKKEHFLSALAILIFMILAFGSKSSEKKPDDLKTEAFVITQTFVEQKLKSPSTAKFPSFDFQSVHLGNGKYKVTSYVDAQNSYGAKIRTNYQCTLKYNSGNWADYTNWTLLNLTFDENHSCPR